MVEAGVPLPKYRTAVWARLLSGVRPIWVLVILVAAFGPAGAGLLSDVPPLPGAPFRLPWWGLAVFFYLTECTVIHLRFHRHAHSFSLSEIPMVVGLHFAAPAEMILAQMAGTFLALGLHRRQAPVKLIFNTGQVSLQAAAAVMVFRGILGDRSPLGAFDSLATIAAVLAALVVANTLVNVAIRLSAGRLSLREMSNVLFLGGLAATMNAALALVAVHLTWLRPSSAWMAAIPPAVLFVAYRAYVGQRQERTRITSVYEVTRELHRSPQIDAALRVAAAKTRAIFEVEEARIILFPEGAEGQAFAVTDLLGFEGEGMRAIEANEVDPIALQVRNTRVGSLSEEKSSDRRSGSRVMGAPLFDGDEVIGAFVVREPVGEVSHFSQPDLTLLETLAGQLSVSLQNGRLEDSLAQLTRLKEELHHQALHDGLTGLANRRLLQERIDDTLKTQRPGGYPALLFLDLDDFKVVNDTYGHQTGDELIRLVADRLQAACRGEDTIARIGGDEFAVLLVGLPRPHEAEVVAERILDTLQRPFMIQGNAIFVSASLGVAHVAAGDESDELLRRADQAMYGAKRTTKGSYEVYADSRSEGVRRWIELRAAIRPAITDGELALHYQPLVDLTTGEMVGAEALIRWTHPELGPVAPPELLAVAEDAGVIDLVAAWTVGRAASDLAKLRRRYPDFWMSFNVSASQLDPEIAQAVSAALEMHQLDPRALTVEITETAATQGSESALDAVADLGVGIALDDFGTGYSSLGRLDRLPIGVLKIDRSFVAGLLEGGEMVQIILDIGRTFGLTTIAEGVETRAQERALLEMGCRLGQGFLYAPALPLADLEQRLAIERSAAPPSL